jgi:hypothetical protein
MFELLPSTVAEIVGETAALCAAHGRERTRKTTDKRGPDLFMDPPGEFERKA